MDEEKSVQDTQPVEENVSDTNVPKEEDTLAQTIQELQRENSKLYERATKAEKKMYALKQEVGTKPSEGASIEDVDTAILVAKGYNDDEINSLRVVARGTGKRLKDVADLPEAKAIVDWKRQNKKTEDATPAPSGRPVPLKPGQKAWAQMNEGERQANFSSMIQSRVSRRAQHE